MNGEETWDQLLDRITMDSRVWIKGKETNRITFQNINGCDLDKVQVKDKCLYILLKRMRKRTL